MSADSLSRVGCSNMLINPAMAKSFLLLEAAFLALVLTASACGRDLNSAQGVADEFVDQHYVIIDLPKRSEEHTSELQSHVNLVCRLLLEKKNYSRTKNH